MGRSFRAGDVITRDGGVTCYIIHSVWHDGRGNNSYHCYPASKPLPTTLATGRSCRKGEFDGDPPDEDVLRVENIIKEGWVHVNPRPYWAGMISGGPSTEAWIATAIGGHTSVFFRTGLKDLNEEGEKYPKHDRGYVHDVRIEAVYGIMKELPEDMKAALEEGYQKWDAPQEVKRVHQLEAALLVQQKLTHEYHARMVAAEAKLKAIQENLK